MQYHSRILGSTCFLLRRVDLFRSIYAAVLRLMYASSMVHIVPSAELPPAKSRGWMKIFIFWRICIRHGACAPNYFCNCGRLSPPLQIPLYWIWCECQSALASVVNNALHISNIFSRVLALAAMSLAYNAILCLLYSNGIYSSIAVWSGIRCTLLVGWVTAHSKANKPFCIWNAMGFSDSSSSGMN